MKNSFEKLTRTHLSLALASLLICLVLLFPGAYAKGGGLRSVWTPGDTVIAPASKDTLHYPIEDRRGDPFSVLWPNGFDLKDPSNIHDSVAYDPVTNRYTLFEKVGKTYYRMPTTYTFEELYKIMSDQAERAYFAQRADALSALNRGVNDPYLQVHPGYFNRIFSTTGIPKLDINPQGLIDVLAGYQVQKIDNPTLPERARSSGGPDFQMNANVNVNAQIGDKLKLPIMYNTQSTFDFTNQLKLDYSGTTDDIIKKIEGGNINFSTKSTLIPSVQSLFGIKAQLQFGKLFVTAAIANQRAASQSITLQGGAASQTFDIKSSGYDVNRDFLLAQYFKNNFNKVMSTAPLITSPVSIVRMEVWVTNRQGSTLNNRIVVGLADLGEFAPYNTAIVKPQGNTNLPYNGANTLYASVTSNQGFRDVTQVASRLQGLGLQQVQDYEQVYARKLNANEYYFNPQAGFICVNTQLQANDVLAVAYQYTYNGRVYQVGEFSTDITPDTAANAAGNQQTLFLKLLKATGARPNLPIWNLMMKNVYSLGSGTLQQQGFTLNVLYDEPGGAAKNYLPFGDANTKGQPVISLVGLDRLNSNNDPQPDGQFDFIPNFTVLPQFSKIIFPILQPFGRDLANIIYNGNPPQGAQDTLFYTMYDSVQFYAQNTPQKDRFEIKGSYKGTSSNQVSLGAFNIPPGSVTVTSGGTTLKEGVDYQVDYSLGTVRILNQSILNSGIPVNVQYENNGSYGLQQRNFMGLRLDYQVNQKLALGATFEKLAERPYYTKVQYGEDPINNAMIGFDANYNSDFPRMTKWLNSLYPTTAGSTIQMHGEVAHLIPGHPAQIGKGTNGAVYIDDFEASSSGIDMRFPFTSWAAASTPYGAKDPNGNPMFTEAALNDNLDYGKNRARLAWYNIETTLQDPNSPDNPLKGNLVALSDPRVRPVAYQELFPQQTTDIGQNQLVTFDLAYYPTARGQYNYDFANVNNNGSLTNPLTRWGGIMRSLDQTDFQTGNIQYIEFWLQDPFITNPTSNGGRLYFNLGNISEDILKDGKHFFENGLSTPVNPAPQDTSIWGNVPRNPIQITNAFSNDPTERPYQDIGLDGMNDAQEAQLRGPYLTSLASKVNAAALAAAQADPSSDDYVNYRDARYDAYNASILNRYKLYNNTEGNSPIQNSNATYSSAATLYPDNEDLNGDNTMNTDEEYFQYHVELHVPGDSRMQIGQNFITDRRNVTVTLLDGQSETEVWYQFRIPINSYETKVGNLPDFSSIQFMRMYMTNFQDTATVLRFAELELVRNQWVNYGYRVDSSGTYDTVTNTQSTTFNVTAVNIEQDDQRSPIPYVIPPGVERQQILSTNNVTLLQNEQSMSLQIYNLQSGDSRAVYKTVSLDLRQYTTLQMFLHCEAANGQSLSNGQATAVIRIGQDFVNNYYQITIPLQVTPPGSSIDTVVWPTLNNLQLSLQDLVQLKLNRKGPITSLYSVEEPNGIRYGVMGVPNLAQVQGVLIGVQNLSPSIISTEVWADELRLTGLNEHGGYAATGRVDVKLADLGTMTASGSIKTIGWGSIDQNVAQRNLATTSQMDISSTLELGKLLPAKANISVPFFGDYSQTVITPEYDPFDQDVTLKQEYGIYKGKQAKDSIKNYAMEVQTLKTINFTNVKKLKRAGKKAKIFDITNIDLSFSYTQGNHHSPTLSEDFLKKYYAGIGYTYNGTPKYWQPFKKLKKKSHWWDAVRDFNLGPKPTQLLFRYDVNRQFGVQQARNVLVPGVTDSNYTIPETFNKYFTIAKTYGVGWDITKSINVSIQALDSARVDEPDGRIDTRHKRDSVFRNFLKGGRNTMWKQNTNITYTLPTLKIPAINWTNISFGYQATYQWTAASQLEEELGLNLGSVIQNTSIRSAKLGLDMKTLYDKVKFFRNLDALTMAQNASSNQKADTSKNKKATPSRPTGPAITGLANNKMAAFFGRLVTMVRTMNMTYSESYSTYLPGFTDSAVAFGGDWKTGAPGVGFTFGSQPDAHWLTKAADQGWLTRDTSFNQMLQQTYDQELAASATLTPIRDLNITLNISKSYQKNFSMLFKDTLGNGVFDQLSPYVNGGFSVSYIGIKTLFKSYNPNVSSPEFLTFQTNRTTLSQRMANANPYSSGFFPVAGYYKGYGQYAQDVLVPSFIAAYTGQDPNKVALLGQQNSTIKTDPFSGYKPLPNWNISYAGLTRIPAIGDLFRTLTLTDNYSGSLSMSGFSSNLTYSDPMGYGMPGFIDTTSGNFVPYFYVPNTTITEQFNPLIGINALTKNGTGFQFSYVKGRAVSLSLVNYQVSEVHNSGFTIGATYKKKGILLPFKVPFSGKDTHRLDNDMIFKLDVSIINNSTSNSILDQNLTTPVAGNKTINIAPSIDYAVNKKIDFRLYFKQTRIIPYISSSPPSVNTQGGIEFKVSLAK